MQPYTPHGDSNLKVHTLVKKLSDATLFLLRFADFCGAPTGACKNRSAAPAVASLFRPLDALAAAAPHGDSNSLPCTVSFHLDQMQPFPLALSRFLRRTCKVLAKTGALLRVAVSQISIAHAVRSQIWTAAPTPARLLLPQAAPRLRCQPRLRCFVRWTRSPRLPLTGTTKNALSAFAG